MIDTFTMAELLKGEYRKTFEQIALYGDMSEVSEQFVEDRMLNIYDLLTEAQENEKPVDKIVGADLEKFCKDYFRVEEKGFWTKEIFKRIFRVSVIMLVFLVVDYLLADELVPIQKATITAKPLLVGILIAGVMMVFGKLVREKLMFRESKTKPIVYYIIAFLIFVGGIGISTIWADQMQFEVSMLWMTVICGGYIVLYLLITWFLRYKRYGSLENPEKPSKEEKAEKKAFQQEVALRFDMISSAVEMEKRYRKLRAKNEKKGKPEYTMVDFAKLVKKETNLISYKIFFIVIPAAATAWLAFSIAKDENLRVTMLVTGLFGVIMFFAWRLIWKACKDVFIAQRAVIEECERRGIDITEYVEEGGTGVEAEEAL